MSVHYDIHSEMVAFMKFELLYHFPQIRWVVTLELMGNETVSEVVHNLKLIHSYQQGLQFVIRELLCIEYA